MLSYCLIFHFFFFKTEGGDDAASRGKLIVLKKKLEDREKALSENSALLEKLEHSVNEKQLIIDTREKQLAEKGQLIVEKEDSERKMLAQIQVMEKVLEKRDAVIEAMRSGGVGVVTGGEDETDNSQKVEELQVRYDHSLTKVLYLQFLFNCMGYWPICTINLY